MKRIDKYKGTVEHPHPRSDHAISQLLGDEEAMNKMIDFMFLASCGEAKCKEARDVLRPYVIGMLEAARKK